jgi:membrane dipeptidase
MSASKLHDDAIVIDGLIISNWSRPVFEAMKAGGLTAANCTCSVWEGLRGTMDNIGRWKHWFVEHGDLIRQVHTTDDIRAAKREGRVGIILGWQNTTAIEDNIDFLAVYHALGVRVVQLTYNTQNFVGTGCWESRDGGLSDFGREAIDEMNRLGILVDLSHVGPKTSEDAIRHSKKPVCYTHVCPAGLHPHARNKSDEQLRFIVSKGGFVGFTTYPWFLPKEGDSTVDDCAEAMEYVINLVGEENVGIGTDFTQDQTVEWMDWLRRDKGRGRWLMGGQGTLLPMPKGFESLAERRNLTAAMERRGWKETRIRRVLGENWLRFLKEVWGS